MPIFSHLPLLIARNLSCLLGACFEVWLHPHAAPCGCACACEPRASSMSPSLTCSWFHHVPPHHVSIQSCWHEPGASESCPSIPTDASVKSLLGIPAWAKRPFEYAISASQQHDPFDGHGINDMSAVPEAAEAKPQALIPVSLRGSRSAVSVAIFYMDQEKPHVHLPGGCW